MKDASTSGSDVDVAIREATVADARAIAEVHVEGWRWGYRGLLPDEVIDALDVDRREQQWVTGFTDRWRDGDACFVAEDGAGRAIGFAAAGPSADEHAQPPDGAGEVYSIYLREAARDRGVGRRLLAAVERSLREHGFRRAVLWVLEDNARARAFYERAGWGWDGTRSEHRFDDGPDLPILRYARDL
jgi:ribosomal protein S18 acetylase RimI-like enzyme